MITHKHTHPCTICSINISGCITQRPLVCVLEPKWSCFFLCLFSQLRWGSTNGRGLSSKVTSHGRRLDMGREARGPSFLPDANHPPPKGPLSSSIFHTDSGEADRSRSHPAFSSIVFIGMTWYTSVAKINTPSSAWCLHPITSYFCDRVNADHL